MHPSSITGLLLCCALLVVGSTPELWAVQAEVQLPAERNDDPKIIGAMEKIEARIEELQALQPEERERGMLRLGSDLKRLVDTCTGMRLHNKALYLYASWQLEYGELAEVDPLVNQILTSQWPHYRNPAQHLRARLRIRQGRLEEARRGAQDLVEKVPSFSPILELIDYHASVGRPAPRLQARNMNGGSNDPIVDRGEPWLLVCFAQLTKADNRHIILGLLEELRNEAYQGRIQPVVVSFDSEPLGAMTHINGLEGGSELDLLWVNPANPVQREQWFNEWGFPSLPSWVLLGPDRSLLAVEPDINQLRPLVNLRKQKEKRVKSPGNDESRGKKRMFGWKGKK